MNKVSYDVKFPITNNKLRREDEYFIIIQNEQEQRLRIQDYSKIYTIPGLYEYVLIDLLKLKSHEVISKLLIDEVVKSQSYAAELSILELAAGVGLVGKSLKDKGVKSIVGVDLIQEAAEAVKRDRPDAYDRYYVEKLPHVTEEIQKELENYKFNCLVCASALTGGLPGSAFAFAYNLISDGGWIAFNIRDNLINTQSNHNSGRMIATIIKEGILKVAIKESYQHRISVTGDPLQEIALIGLKMRNIPLEIIE
ncbi:MAG: hypothetical protein F6K58_07375 [Symploca sp. SIO2E9]|nr:hypothetical protein [Symploca sp. SIO2E9]